MKGTPNYGFEISELMTKLIAGGLAGGIKPAPHGGKTLGSQKNDDIPGLSPPRQEWQTRVYVGDGTNL
jgi:hypothetical protein